MTAKTGAQTPQSPIRGLRRSIVPPRQRDSKCLLQTKMSAAFSLLHCSQHHHPSPHVPARCPRENSDTVPSGKTDRRWSNSLESQMRRINPPMNFWNRWVSATSRISSPNKGTEHKCLTVTIHHTHLLCLSQDNQRMQNANGTLRRKLKEAEREVEILKTLLKRHALHPVEEDSSS